MRWMCWWAAFWVTASAHAGGLVPISSGDPAETVSAGASQPPANSTQTADGRTAGSDETPIPVAGEQHEDEGAMLPDLPAQDLSFAGQSDTAEQPVPAAEKSLAPYAPIDPNQQTLTDAVDYFSSPQDRLWYGRLDWLYWEATDPKPKAMVFQTASSSPTSPNFNGAIRLDDPNTDHEMGLRFWIGRKLSEELGVEFGGLWVNPTNYIEEYFAGIIPPSDFSGLTLNVVSYFPTGELVGFANMSFRSRYWGLEANGRWMLLDGPTWGFEAVGGVRYLNYAERLAFEYEFANLVDITERFDTNNNNIGGQIGGDFTAMLFEYLGFFAHTRAGLLGNVQDVDVTGPLPGRGRLTNASNLGAHDDCEMSVLLEFNVGLEWFWTPDISFMAGYSGIWLSEQIRSADQVDLPQSVPGGNPIVSLKSDDIWLQGFMAGLKAKW